MTYLEKWKPKACGFHRHIHVYLLHLNRWQAGHGRHGIQERTEEHLHFQSEHAIAQREPQEKEAQKARREHLNASNGSREHSPSGDR